MRLIVPYCIGSLGFGFHIDDTVQIILNGNLITTPYVYPDSIISAGSTLIFNFCPDTLNPANFDWCLDIPPAGSYRYTTESIFAGCVPCEPEVQTQKNDENPCCFGIKINNPCDEEIDFQY